MSEQLSPLSLEGDIDRSLFEENDWLSGIFQRQKHLKARALHTDPVELRTVNAGDDRPTTPKDGDVGAVEESLSDASPESPPLQPMRFIDDSFDPARVVK